MHIQKLFLIFFVSAFCLFASATDDKQKIMNILDSIALEESNSPSDFEYLNEKLSTTDENVSELLIQQLNSGKISEKQKAIYIWALGLTKDKKAHDLITGIYNEEKDKKSLISGNCLNALAMINAGGAGDFIYDILKKTEDSDMRFHIMRLLARMHYEKALPDFAETLDKEQWKSMLLFGKMGEKSVSVLIGKLSDPNPEIRGNAAFLLGHFLISEAAISALIEQYKKESIPGLKTIIIGGIERTEPDLKKQEQIFQEMLQTENDPDVITFLNESIARVPSLKKNIKKNIQQGKHTDRTIFESEYKKLFDSYGKAGSYDILSKSSSKADEERLLKLRDRILEIESDEAFERVERLNTVITSNRIKEKLNNERQ